MTAQFSDYLMFEGRRFALDTEPLSPWLACKKNRAIRFRRSGMSHQRGYRASWAVHRGHLYLTHFSARLSNGRFAGLKTLFENYSQQFYQDHRANHPDNQGPGSFAFWFSGWLCCHFGELIRYEHSAYGSLFEGALQLLFKNGFLIGQRIVHHEPAAAPTSTGLDRLFTLEELEELLIERELLKRARSRASQRTNPL